MPVATRRREEPDVWAAKSVGVGLRRTLVGVGLLAVAALSVRSWTGSPAAVARPGAPQPQPQPQPQPPPQPQPQPQPPPQLRHDGRWLIDPQGRVVTLHGVNAVWKRPPYAAPATPGGFTTADADFLAANGFDAVRLGVLFAGVMPEPGVVDHAYLDGVDRVVQLLASRHIWVLLDFHQDQYNERFQGEGFPAWSVDDSGLPDDARYGFPGNYFGSLALDAAYDNLWADRGGLWDRYREAWKAVAAKWATQPYLMGYELINEPWPGTVWPTCVNPLTGCPAFDATLQRFQDEARAGIREVDPSNLVWFEGSGVSNYGLPNGLGDTPIADPAIGYSWHAYCASSAGLSAAGAHSDGGCAQEEQYALAGAESTDRRLGAAFLMTEFGGSDDLGDLARVTASADQHLLGWVYWSYKTWSDPTGGAGAESMFGNDADLSSLKVAKADVLVRPYARAVAGMPLATAFDPATKVFSLSYTPRDAGGPTEVFVPSRQYPRGYEVRVAGARVASAAGASDLELVAAPGATRVSAEVLPATSSAVAGARDVSPTASPTPAGGAPNAPAGATPTRSLAATGGPNPWLPAGITILLAAAALRLTPGAAPPSRPSDTPAATGRSPAGW
ncbi:MAG: cellulase family glycosylhydrolase [Acidimicrobiia bacterium]|nr:cellulase family glycosylhydrolase [Acidimicrobiia bacterium]